ncbi:MAG: hypothetical protein ACYTGP_05745 [Planctomycetota bacterium]|jgi:hypothetical protein
MGPTLAISVLIGLVIVGIGVLAIALRRREERDAAARGGPDDLARFGRTRDARGEVVKLLDPIPMYMLRRYDVIDAEPLEKIAEEVEPGAKSRRPLLIVAVVAGVAVLAGIALMLMRAGGPSWRDLLSAAANPAILAAVLGGMIAPIVAARQQRIARVRNAMLRHERCPHCGYGLTGVPRGADGATVCPECECAWPLGDVPGPAAASTGALAGGGRGRLVLVAGGLLALMFAGLLAFMLFR